MLARPQIESFTKFLLSAGVFLCIAAFVMPALVLRETTVLRLPRTELARLTPVARQELERRQRLSRDVGHAAPYATIVLLAAGLALVVCALPRMRSKERTEDALAAASLKKLDAETAPQSTQERQRSLVADVNAAAADEHPSGRRDGAREGEVASTVARARSDILSPPAMFGSGGQDRIRRAERIEQLVLRRVASAMPPGYDLKANVRIGAPDRPLLLDGLLASHTRKGRDVLIEIKHAPRPTSRIVLAGMQQLSASLLRYMSRVSRSAAGWLIVVCDDSVEDYDLRRMGEMGDSLQVESLAITVIREREINELLPPDFDA